MGMFDYIRCEYPTDAPKDTLYQTKDTDEQFLCEYLISKIGKLYLVNDGKKIWQKDFRGEIYFYPDHESAYASYSAFFDSGKLFNIKRIEDK